MRVAVIRVLTALVVLYRLLSETAAKICVYVLSVVTVIRKSIFLREGAYYVLLVEELVQLGEMRVLFVLPDAVEFCFLRVDRATVDEEHE